MNVASNIASILGLILAVFVQLRWNATAIPLLYLCGLSLFLILRYLRHERWARYAEGVQVLNRALRRLKETTDRSLFGSSAAEDTLMHLQESLSAFAEAFTLVTGSNCRATIKEVYWEDVPVGKPGATTFEIGRELFVATLARSDIDASRKVSEESPDRVTENSDFEEVVSSLQPFHNGDLPKAWLSRKYRNSHWRDKLRESRKFPYKSAIVWPVDVDRPTTTRASSEQDGGDDPVIALLCVDSDRRHAFRPRADVQFGGLYAHGLYPVLQYIRD